MADVDPSDAGETVPFDDFYARAWPDAARLAYGLTGDASVAEELAQDAFVVAHARYAELHSPYGFSYRTIVNLAREHHRANGRRIRRERRAGLPPSEDAGTSGELLDLLGALPYDQRAVLVLRYWLDWDEASIAAALGCAGATVRSHAKRGLGRLRRALEDTG